MITLITGARNSGKSSRFLRMYKEAGGDAIGLFSLKMTDSTGEVIGYDLVLLPTEERMPLARLVAQPDAFSEEDCLYQGRFVFSSSAFQRAETYILKQSSTSVWIDEVGKLEFQGKGYDGLIQELLEKDISLVLTVRDRYLSTFLNMFRDFPISIIRLP